MLPSAKASEEQRQRQVRGAKTPLMLAGRSGSATSQVSHSPLLYLQPFCPRGGDREEWKGQRGTIVLQTLRGFLMLAHLISGNSAVATATPRKTNPREREHKSCGTRHKIFISTLRSAGFSCCS